MRAGLAALVLSSITTLATSASAATGVPCSFYGVDPGPPIAGGQVLLDGDLAARLYDAGAGAVRVELSLRDPSGWSAEALSQYDRIIDAVLGAGLTPLGVLSYASSPGGQVDWNDDADGDGYNPYVEVFAGTAEALVTHFAGRVERWEIWSQPNCASDPDFAADPRNAGCTYILPRVLARILVEVYARNEALFRASKISLTTGGVLVADDGFSSFRGDDYLGELYDQPIWNEMESRFGRRYPWNYIGYQLFVDQSFETDGASLGAYLDPGRGVARRYDDTSRFIITAIGWGTASLGEELQAANLTTALGYLSARSDVAAAYWYRFRDDPALGDDYGLVTETLAPKAAYGAMRAAAEGCEADGPAGGAGDGSGDGDGSIAVIPGQFGGSGRAGPYRGDARASSCGLAPAAGAAPAVRWLAVAAAAARIARRRGGRVTR